VTFLLQVLDQPLIDHAQKERLIQTGRFHYSELLGPEHEPSVEYLDAFHRAMSRNSHRVAEDSLALASRLAQTIVGRIAVVSLARAGTPVGVLVTRLLRRVFRRDAVHFSVSIIAGRGIDEAAIDQVLSERGIAPSSIAFVDGWTGKGVISSALRTSIERYNDARGVGIDPTLNVLLDICGVSGWASNTIDYLIPSCLLGATISGLISRTFQNDMTVASGRHHGCRYYEGLADRDLSRRYVDDMTDIAMTMDINAARRIARGSGEDGQMARAELSRLRTRYACSSESRVKPGLCEAVRVLLRRIPGMLIVRDVHDPDVEPLLILAREKSVAVEVDTSLRWRAVSLIADIDGKR